MADITLNVSAMEGLHRAVADAALETMGLLRGEVVSAQVMPFDTGTMQNDMTAVTQSEDGDVLTTSLVTDGPQPRHLYNHPEYDFQKGNNPNAGGAWLAPWLPGGTQTDFIAVTYAKELEKRMGK